MTLDPRWEDPRASIAFRYKENDFAYSMHGAVAAMTVLRTLDLKPSECKQLTILDYGCGTGREARVLSQLFKKVIAFDPTQACLDTFQKEIKQCEREFPNIELVNSADKIPVCDVGYSMHVIEHLDEKDSQFMVDQLKAKVRGNVCLAYHAEKNREVLKNYLSTAVLVDDETRFKKEKRVIRVRLVNFNPQAAHR